MSAKIVYFCDRCGKDFAKGSDESRRQFLPWNVTISHKGNTHTLELCLACHGLVVEFLGVSK